MEGVLSTDNKLDKKKVLAMAIYQKYMSMPGNGNKILQNYKEYYRKRKEELLGGDLCES